MTMSIDGVQYQVRLKWLYHSQHCFNVLYFHNLGSQDIETNLLQVLLDCVTTHLLPVLAPGVTLLGADFKNVTGTTAQEGEVALSSGNVGTDSSNGLPSTNAAVIKIVSVHPGRTGKGRMFIPGIPEDRQATSTLDATFIAAAVAFIACMIAGFYNVDPVHTPFFHWVLRSKKDNQYYQITNGIPTPTIGTLRSRKLGHGV